MSLLAGQASSREPIVPFSGGWELHDCRGTVHKLSDWRDRKVVVVVFLGVECPLAQQYGERLGELARKLEPQGVAFLGIDSNAQDSAADMRRYLDAQRVAFPFLKDPAHLLAETFGASRTPEVLVLDALRRVRYRGRIDDQYAGGAHRAKPMRLDLAIAIDEVLRGSEVTLPVTEAPGCLMDQVAPAPARGAVTFHRDVAPILNQHCVACHRPGEIGPFPLTTYARAARWARAIRRAVDSGVMPPWHADPRYGRFANANRLTAQEKQTLDEWIRGGCAEGNAADLTAPPVMVEGWNIPQPDVVIAMPAPFTVPAGGTVEYQSFEVDPHFQEDRWVRAAEIRPGNRRVVHHCTVFLKPPGTDEPVEQGALGSFCLAATAPGTPPLVLPDGMAKLVPAGWRLVFLVHYAPVGTVQTDQTSIGLVFADPGIVRKEVATRLVFDNDLYIPARAPNYRVEHEHRFTDDVLLLALFPHMHLRGKEFQYEAEYVDGRREILLRVKPYDFNWQNRYVFAEPKRLPAGTVLHCIAHYDNSANNPANPDPTVAVRAGPQSEDEMFNGYFEWALADQDLTQPPLFRDLVVSNLRRVFRPAILLVVIPLAGALLLLERRRKALRLAG
jgi:peroxiredoxin